MRSVLCALVLMVVPTTCFGQQGMWTLPQLSGHQAQFNILVTDLEITEEGVDAVDDSLTELYNLVDEYLDCGLDLLFEDDMQAIADKIAAARVNIANAQGNEQAVHNAYAALVLVFTAPGASQINDCSSWQDAKGIWASDYLLASLRLYEPTVGLETMIEDLAYDISVAIDDCEGD